MKRGKLIWPVILCSLALGAGCDRTNDDNTLGEDIDRAGDKVAREAAQVRADAERGLDSMGQKMESGIDTAANRVEQSAESARANVAEGAAELGDDLSDSGLTVKTKSALIADPDLSALRIDVDTKNGVVTLRGEAKSPAAVEKASMVVKGIEGVVGVDNQLRIDPAG